MASFLEMRGITKFFASSNVLASDNVNFNVEAGTVHALVGENGAGKTTLMNILYGLISPDSGDVLIDGKPVKITHPDEAIRNNIGMVHQHFKLVPSFTIAENIMLGIEPSKMGYIDRAQEAEEVRKLSEEFGLPVDPTLRVQDLSVGMQQRVEILKSLQRDARILILDEPTAVLTPQEVRELYVIIRRLANEGRSVILITHKLVEVVDIADHLTVMRRGQVVGTDDVKNVTVKEIANLMVGREVILTVDRKPANPGQVVLKVADLLVADNNGLPAVTGVDLEVREGEILGLAGVSGNGQTELIEAIAGTRQTDSGNVYLFDSDITLSTVKVRRDKSMAHIPEDRMTTGLNLLTNIDENVIVTMYDDAEYHNRSLLQYGKIQDLARRLIDRFSIASAQVGEGISTLSGGNLQKIVVARELENKPKFIIANQPTRGVDVGSIEFIHQTLIDTRDAGTAVLLVSVELDEILALSDRVAVMYEGKIMGILEGDDLNKETLGLLMAGATIDDVIEAVS
jgi:general nucleoside transport system ATP-binding protein